MTRARQAVAAITAPLVVPIVYFIGMALFTGYTQQGPGHMEKLVETTLRAVAPLAYFGSFAAGIPLAWLLKRTGRLTLRNSAVGMGIVGALGAALVVLVFRGPDHIAPSAADYLLVIPVGAIGALVGVTFCLIAGIRAR